MHKFTFTILFVMTFTKVLAQVGIGNISPQGTLDITAVKTDGTTAEGILMPRLTGDQIRAANNQYTADQAGTIVYATSADSSPAGKTINITEKGYYYFDGIVWREMGAQVTNTNFSYSSAVDPNILGYIPSPTATASANAPTTTTVGGATATRQAIGTYSGNGHSYASYSTSVNVTWYDAYNAAKAMGGYLATFTTDGEWQYVDQNIINGTIFNTNRGWIGFVKFSWYAGSALTPNPEMKWITGEQPLHDYSSGGNAAIKKSNWFMTGEPNNTNSTEGFVHFWSKNDNNTLTNNGYTTVHPWNDYPANLTGAVLGFVVEFQQ